MPLRRCGLEDSLTWSSCHHKTCAAVSRRKQIQSYRMWIMRQKVLLLSCFVLIAAEFESDADLRSRGLNRTKRSKLPCAPKFQVLEKHSACLPRSNNPGVSEADKKSIVDIHNEKRSSVSPEATNMLRMSWDDEVAMIAQRWADNCVLGHDKNGQRIIPGRFGVGQNLAMGARDWSHAIKMWHDEVKYFEYGNQQKMINIFSQIGHYTQMVWAETSKIGCGFSVCGRTKYYVCNYSPSGNLNNYFHLPYKSGPSCSQCQPGKCSDKLCDCGLVCLNGGTINTNACTCKCLNDFFLQPNCRLKCKEQDPGKCSPGGVLSSYNCDVVRNICPVRCQVCPYAEDGYSGLLHNRSTARSTSSACCCWFLVLLKVLVVIFCKNFT